ncbi:Uncharacterised protein [Cedecea lapagei]|uniref:Uncharacterized protein n=1 Tax=Cedecea lapagei TaxID=158823 RepID=A0A3S4ICL5_9ENTR|nr:hypothetical protein [Cedecea lapagei]VEB96046.1 Uncharacterised protein [Cedecea lapagei]
MSVFKGTGLFFIQEKIFNKSGLPTFANTIGPTSIQVVKSVFELIEEYDSFYKGKLIDFEKISLWDQFKVMFGVDVSEIKKKNGKLAFSQVYCGFRTLVKPIDGFDEHLPKSLTKQRNISIPTPYTFGKDPVPNVSLYGNIAANFYISDGGTGVPSAFAKYNSKTKEVRHVASEREFIDTMNGLTIRKS